MPRATNPSSSRRRRGHSRVSRGAKIGWSVAGGLVLVLLVGLLVAYQRARGWLRGEEFRSLVESRVGEVAKGAVELEPLSWEGWSAWSPRAEVVGWPEAGYRRIDLEGLRVVARPGGVLRGAWELPMVKLDHVVLEYRLGRRDALDPAGGEPGVPTVAPAPGRKGGLGGLLPQRVELGQLQVGRLDVRPEDPAGVTAEGVAVRIDRQPGGGGFVAQAEGGRVSLPVLPSFELRRLEARANPQSINLIGGRLFRADRGQLELEGRIGLGPEVGTDLSVELTQLPLEAVVAEDWKQRLQGQAQADLRYRSEGGRQELEGTVGVLGGQVTLLPVLDRLARYFDNEQLRRVVFEDARCRVNWRPGRTELSEIDLHSRGLLRLQGTLVLDGERVDGTLNFGVTPGLLARLPQAEQRVFAEDREGMRWTPVRLGGTLAKLDEDLSGRIIAAATQRMIDWLPEGLREQAVAGGELAIGAVPLLGGAGEEGGRATSSGALLEQGRQLLESGAAIERGRHLVEGAGGAVDQARDLAGSLLGTGSGEGASSPAENGNGGVIERGGQLIEQGGGLIQRGGGLLGDLFGRPAEAPASPAPNAADNGPAEGADEDEGQDGAPPTEAARPEPPRHGDAGAADSPELPPNSGEDDLPEDAEGEDVFGF